MRNKNFIKAFVFLFVVVVLLLSVNSIITFTGKVITESQSSVQNSNFMLDSFRRTNLESINSVNLHGEIPSSVTQINMNTFQEGNLFETESQEPSLNYSGFIVELKEEPRVKKRVELEELAKKNQEIIDTYPVYSPIKVLNLISGVDEKNLDIFIASAQQRQISEKEKVKSEVVNLVQEKINQGKNPLTGNAIFEDTQINPENIITAEFQELFNGFAINVDEETAREIGEIEGVKRVWPNMIVQATLMDSVPLIQDGIPAGQLDFDGNDCTASGKECLTGKGVKIAILDTGVDYTHPDLGACTTEQFLTGKCEKVIGGYDFVTCENWDSYSGDCLILKEPDSNPLDEQGHGTHCASIAAGNGVLKGVAPEAQILSYRVLNKFSSGDSYWVISGIERAVEDDVDILSLSLGGYGNPDDPLSQAVDNAVLAGKVVVVAAGNEGPSFQTISSPGCAKNAITVGSISKSKKLSDFSSKGPVVWKDLSDSEQILLKPDVLAPGESICAAKSLAVSSEKPTCLDSSHVVFSGTSMATPHVAGAVALLKQKNRDLFPQKIKEFLKEESVLPDYGPRYKYPSTDLESLFYFGSGVIHLNNLNSLEEMPSLNLEIHPIGNEINLSMFISGNNLTRYSLEYFHEYLDEWEVIHSNSLDSYLKIISLRVKKSDLDGGIALFRVKVENTLAKKFYFYNSLSKIENFEMDKIGVIENQILFDNESVYVKHINDKEEYKNFLIYYKEYLDVGDSSHIFYPEEEWHLLDASFLESENSFKINKSFLNPSKYKFVVLANSSEGRIVASKSSEVGVIKDFSQNGFVKQFDFLVDMYDTPSFFTPKNTSYILFSRNTLEKLNDFWNLPHFTLQIRKFDEDYSSLNQTIKDSLIYTPLSGHINYLPFLKNQNLFIWDILHINHEAHPNFKGNYLLGVLNPQGEYQDFWPYFFEPKMVMTGNDKKLFSTEKNLILSTDCINFSHAESKDYSLEGWSESQCKFLLVFDNQGNLLHDFSSNYFKEEEVPSEVSSRGFGRHEIIYFNVSEEEFLFVLSMKALTKDNDFIKNEVSVEILNLTSGKISNSKILINSLESNTFGSWIKPLAVKSEGEIKFVLFLGTYNGEDSSAVEMFLLDSSLKTLKKVSLADYILWSPSTVLEEEGTPYILSQFQNRKLSVSKLMIFDLEGNKKFEFDSDYQLLVAGDINNDKKTEIVLYHDGAGFNRPSLIRIHTLSGELIKEIKLPLPYPLFYLSQLSLGDYNQDSKLDLSFFVHLYDSLFEGSGFFEIDKTILYRLDLGYEYIPENLYWPSSYDPTFSGCYKNCQEIGGYIEIKDTLAPIYSDANHSNTTTGQATEFSVLWGDETSLNPNGKYIFSTNNTGIWINDSEVKFSMTPIWANVTKTLVSQVGVTIGYRWYASDNASNWNSTPIYSFVTAPSSPIPIMDKTAPTYSNIGHQISLSNLKSTTIKFFSYWNDETSLNPNGQYIFSTNASGVWKNNSPIKFSITPSWANSTLTISTGAKVIGYKWYASDNASNWNSTQVYSLKVGNIVLPPENPVPVEPPKETPNPVEPPIEEEPIPIKPTEPIKQSGDVYPPTYMNVVHLNTYAGLPAAFSITWIDETSLTPNGEYIFSTDNSGQWVNDTPVKFGTSTSAIVGKSITVPVTKILTSQSGKTVSYRWYASDNSGNWRATETYSFVTKTNWRTLLSRVTGNIIRFFFKE